MAQTAHEYYEGDNWGDYQYLKLSEIINDFILQTHDNTNFLYGTPRHLIVRHAKAALRTLTRDAAKEHKALELAIGDDLVFRLPQDFVNYVRVSLVTDNNELLPLDINYNLNTAETYLQDNEYRLMFDSEGGVLKSDGNNLTNKPYHSYHIRKEGNGGMFQVDTSRFSENGEFTIDKRRGIIYFSSKLAGKNIVLEYQSDGLEWERIHEEEITFHKNLKDALEDLIYFYCIERKANVPANEKHRANLKYKTSRHRAKVLMAEFDLRLIERVWRKGTKWVKS